MERHRQSLNEWWEYSVNGVRQGRIQVPFSRLCVGDSQCVLCFDADSAPCTLLCFEGITYRALVTLNGQVLGEMGPYSRYVFDVTALLKRAGNDLTVDIVDRHVPFGPSEGWENYGGIIRDVYLEYRSAVHVRDVVWRTRTEAPYRLAECIVVAEIAGAARAPVSVMLMDEKGRLMASSEGTAENGEASFSLTVTDPALWSPDSPHLYRLTVRTGDDTYSQLVGIKDFQIRGQRFLLNGQPIFLRGVNRHDLYGDQGHTLTLEQMEQDMLMIKGTGCNYVRLVHYPHHPHILELADRLGLLVSEESGLWWSDLQNPQVVAGALETMRRVVIRDRNRCSVVFWLAFNECVFTSEFLEASSALCHRLDPDRPVSGANAMDKEMTRELFKRHGFDFYTRHPYTFHIEQFRQEAAYLNDMPLVFTEWGGWFVFENGHLFEDSLREMIDLWRNDDGQPVLAGCAYWCWADMNEFGRGKPACERGELNEGLVDICRRPRSNLDRFTRIMTHFDLPETSPSHMTVTNGSDRLTGAVPIPIWQGVDEAWQRSVWEAMLTEAKTQLGCTQKRQRRLTLGPVLPQTIDEAAGVPLHPNTRVPLVIPPGQALTLPIGQAVGRLFVLGHTALPWGYPAEGQRGEVGASYTLLFSDGERTLPLRNGIELTTALALWGASRIEPVASDAARALAWQYDENWERYVANMYTVRVNRFVEAIRVESRHPSCTLLLYAITVQQPEAEYTDR